MTTSKIKEVVNTNEWKSPTGKLIIYHSLLMDNGDKINLGKMKMQEVGWELTYEIIEEGQQEFNKAKAVQKENVSFNSRSASPASNDERQTSIIRQSSLKSAVEYLKGAEASLEEVYEVAEKFIDWVNKKPKLGAKEEMDKIWNDKEPF
jgi:hypothetical protein